MKIKEFVREFGVDQVDVGKDIGQDWKKGSDFVKNIVDPKRWFGGSSDSSNARVKKHLSNVETRDALNAAIKGKLYQDDIGALKQIINNIKNGTFKAGDPKGTINAINASINGQPLSQEQSAMLQQLAGTF